MDSNMQSKMPLDPDLVFGKSKPVVRHNILLGVFIISTIGAVVTVVVYFVAANQRSDTPDPVPRVNPVCKDQCV